MHSSGQSLVHGRRFLVYPNSERRDKKCLSLVECLVNGSTVPLMIEGALKWFFPLNHRGERRIVLVDQDTGKMAELPFPKSTWRQEMMLTIHLDGIQMSCKRVLRWSSDWNTQAEVVSGKTNWDRMFSRSSA